MTNDARSFDFRSRMHDTANDPLGPDLVPQTPVWIDGRNAHSVVNAAMPVEIPPGHTVLRGDDCRVGAKPGLQTIKDSGQRMCLQRQKYIILRTELCGPASGAHHCGRFARALFERQASLAHRREMGAARDEIHFDVTLPCKLGADETANGARAEDANAH